MLLRSKLFVVICFGALGAGCLYFAYGMKNAYIQGILAFTGFVALAIAGTVFYSSLIWAE